MKKERGVKLDRTEVTVFRWVCGSELKERKTNAEIRECVGLLVVMI